jgi:DNA-binding GntR family transcriptional regulator
MAKTQPESREKSDHGLRRRGIVQSLLMEIFQGRLRAGQHLVTQDLSERFGVSHTPIREALITLEGIGVIDLIPNRGAVIRPVTTNDVREICEVRRVLECAATRGACGWIAPSELETLRSDFAKLVKHSAGPSQGFLQEAMSLDSRLHDLIAASCRNEFLAKEIGRLKILFRAFRDVNYSGDRTRFASGRFEAEAREHLAIVRALLAGDAKVAVKAMSRHIRTSVDTWTRTLPDVVDGPGSAASDGRSAGSPEVTPVAEGVK